MQRSRIAPLTCYGLVMGALALSQFIGYAQSWAGTPSWLLAEQSSPDLQEPSPELPEKPGITLEPRLASSSLWEKGVGEGFREGTWLGEASAGIGIGLRAMGTRKEHDFVLSSFQAGRILTGMVGEGKWYQGSFECLGMVFGGAQVEPHSRYLVGFNPGARYHFMNGSRVVPFIGLSAGVAATDIKEPDLSTIFQFNEQYGMGLHWYVKDEFALSLEYRLMHISNAGIEQPNNGVNSNLILAGLHWRF